MKIQGVPVEKRLSVLEQHLGLIEKRDDLSIERVAIYNRWVTLPDESERLRQKFLFIAEDFSVDNGLLTQTLKLIRRNVMKKYGDKINALYNEK